MDATDADGEWSDEEILRSGSQTGVSDDQDNNLSSDNNKRNKKIQGADSPAQGEETQLTSRHSKGHHHRPSLGSIISDISSNNNKEATSLNLSINGHNGHTIKSPEPEEYRVSKPSTSISTTPTRSFSMMASAPDPVCAILDKIDAQIDAMDAKDMSIVPQVTNGERKPHRSHRPSSTRSKTPQSGKSGSGLNGSADTGVGSLHDSEISDLDNPNRLISGSAEIYSEPNLTDGITDDERTKLLDSDIPSDLDSVAAQQIDLKFKEIMSKKKDDPDEAAAEMTSFVRRFFRRNSTGSFDRKQTIRNGKTTVPPDLPVHPSATNKASSTSRGAAAAASQLGSKLRSRSATRPSATMLSTGYGTDNESVRTEEFETKFMTLLVGSGQGGVSDSDGGGFKSTRDFSEKQPVVSDLPEVRKSHIDGPREEVPGLAKEDEELLQKLVRVANETKPLTASPSSMSSRPRSLSPTRMRGEKKVVSIQDYRAEQEEQEETAREIQRESARIQRELERERRSRSVSPLPTPRGSTPSPPPAYKKSTLRSSSVKRSPTPGKGHNDVKKMLADTAAHFSDAEDQLIAGHELKTLRQALLLTKRELRESEGQLKDARQLSEDAKSTLMVLEFKRGSATKDLDRLNEEIHRRKGQMSAVEAELQAKLTEMKNMTSLGVTREDCLDVKATKEENVCLKTKVRNLEGLQLERDELVRQLDIAKEDLLREQKAYRLQCAELQEELETLTARLEETQNGWGNGQEKMAKLDAAYRRMEKEKNEIIQDKIRECEALRTLQKEESDHAKGRLRKEMNELDLEVQEFRVRVNDLSQENGSKDTIIEKMRAQISELQSILVKERDDRHKTSTEQKRALQHLKKETAAAVMKLKESLFLDKQKAVEDLKVELEQERRESGARSEDRLAQMIEDHSYEIQKKNQEIMKLQDSIRKLEKDTQIDLDKQIRDAVSRERERSDKERDWQLRQEREENKRKITDMTSQVERERTTTRELHTEITSLKKELDEQRRQQREASKEKLVAVARAKEQMKDQSSAEIDRVRFNLKQEHERDVARLEEKLQYQLEELTSLRTEHEQITQRERNVLMALEHAEKTVIKEINEECEKVSTILGISPRTVHHTSFHLDNAEGRMSPSFRTRPVLNSALANLRACNEELHNHILELQQEVESLRVMVETVTKEKEEAIENCKLQMEKQRTLDLEKLKDKLLKEHVQEISEVVRDCAEGKHDHYAYLQRHHASLPAGDSQAVLLAALQAKDEELRTLSRSTSLWKAGLEEKFNTQLQLQMAKEREKYQAQQHHSTREQSRISDLQKREIERLERELRRVAASQSHPPADSNRYRPSSPAPSQLCTPSDKLESATTSATVPSTATVIDATAPQQKSKSSTPSTSAAATAATSVSAAASSTAQPSFRSSQQYLQNRIDQLQAENASLRKNRLFTGAAAASYHLQRQPMWSSPSLPDLARPQPVRPISPLGRSRSPLNVASRRSISERIRQGEKDALEAEQRARLNQKAMSNKMEEMAQLQNTLISQNQELQELEKAYNDLHKHYCSSRPLSPTSALNTTV